MSLSRTKKTKKRKHRKALRACRAAAERMKEPFIIGPPLAAPGTFYLVDRAAMVLPALW